MNTTDENPIGHNETGDAIKLAMPDTTVIRTARKSHRCCGGWKQDVGRIACFTPIEKGEKYVEYYGESAAYESGKRYHMSCAIEQGLLQ